MVYSQLTTEQIETATEYDTESSRNEFYVKCYSVQCVNTGINEWYYFSQAEKPQPFQIKEDIMSFPTTEQVEKASKPCCFLSKSDLNPS